MTTAPLDAPAATEIGLIGVGEVGSGLMRGFLAAGHPVVAFDVRPEPSAALEPDLAGSGMLRFADLETAGGCPMVVSAVVPGSAIDVVAALAAAGVAPALLDVNSTGPTEKAEMSAIAGAAGFVSFTDGTIGGGGFRLPNGPVLYLAGPGARAWEKLLADAGFSTEVMGSEAEDVGKAATLKMLRSVFTKGYEGLIVESLLAARRAGIVHEVVASIGSSFDGLAFATLAESLACGHVTHAGRRADEIAMAAATAAELGAPESELLIVRAARARFELDRDRVGDRYGRAEPEDLDAALEVLAADRDGVT
jgi:3-hydroxyisobutyrate dehydrogenase-like beta-hydroxyacid dehydrogenase